MKHLWIVLVGLVALVGCSGFPEAENTQVNEITFRDGWHVYRIIDRDTGLVYVVSPTSYYGVTVALPTAALPPKKAESTNK